MDPNQQVGNSSVPPAPVPGVAPQPVPPMQPAQAVPTFVAPAPDPTPTQVQIQPNNTFVNATTDLLTSSANPLAATAEPLAPSAEPVVPLAPPSLEQAPVEATPDLAALANELSSAPNLTTPPQGATDALLQTPPAENLSLTGGPEPDSPPVLTPSADLMATSTVSAVPDLNAAANELTSAPDPNASSAPEPTQTVAANASATGDFVNDPNATADQGPAKIENTDDNPLVAAAPVPGSIGSAKSYADIQREEAERTAQAAAKKQAKNKMANSLNKLKGFKMNKTTAIILIAVVALVLIGVVVGITVFSGDSNKNSSSSTTPTTPVVQTPAKLTLTCQRSLENDEMAFGSISGNQQNIFVFEDGVLSSLRTNFNYTYATTAEAENAKATVDSWRNNDNNGEVNTPGTDQDDSGETVNAAPKTVETMRKISTIVTGTRYTYRIDITSNDIEDWLKTTNVEGGYSDESYGYFGTEEPTRDPEFYENIQKAVGFVCSTREE